MDHQPKPPARALRHQASEVPLVPAPWQEVTISATALNAACMFGAAQRGLHGQQEHELVHVSECMCKRAVCECLFVLGAVAKLGVFASRELSAVFVYVAECREGQGRDKCTLRPSRAGLEAT